LAVPDSNSDKIPQVTYNYVFYSVSAAVIGENRRFLVFKFEHYTKANWDFAQLLKSA